MHQLPQLARVPGMGHDDLVIKATSSGITFLKENSFRRRYTGNKYSAVDIQGRLWLKATDLKKEIALSAMRASIGNNGGEWALAQWDGKLPGKKKARVETQAGKNILLNTDPAQISDNLSTSPPVTDGDNNSLSTKKLRTYTVHKREVRQRILGYLNTQRGKKELYFWTVTFPAGTPDDLAYRMYNIWLTSLRQRGMLKDYIWIAERQDGKRNNYKSATNTLHFHIAIPHKMPVQRANAMMRGTLKTFAKRGELNESVYKLNRYNGVDIDKNRKTNRVINFALKKGSRALAGYLTKYLSKNDTQFSHLAWHNSRGYSSLFTGVTFTIPEFVNNGWKPLLNGAKKFECEYFIFIPWRGEPPGPLITHLYQLNSFLQEQLN